MSGEFCRATFRPANRTVRVRAGTTVSEAAANADIFLDGPCGGRGRCGKCRIRLSERASKLTDQEKKLLSPADLEAGVRLACITRVMHDIVVTTLPESAALIPRILTFDSAGPEATKFDPPLCKIAVADVAGRLPRSRTSDVEVLGDTIGLDGADDALPIELLRSLPELLRTADVSRAAAVVSNGRFLGFADDEDDLYGVALDIGTTTVVGALIELNRGEQLSVASRLNAQAVHGADAISRINFCTSRADGLEELNRRVISTINEIIDELSDESGVGPDDIWEVTVAGNSTMMHLFLGITPKYLGLMPYAPAFRRAPKLNAARVGLKVNPHANVHVLPCIGSFVGADSVGVILSSGIQHSDRVRMAVDIGTNGEILLGSSERLLASSTAAGPALEGAEVSCGMAGVAGAIERVEVESGDLIFKVIGNGDPVGVCGSGLVDLVAALLEHEMMEPSGRLLAPEEMSEQVRDRFGKRIVCKPEGNEFVIYSDSYRELQLTQGDVRKIQLAKGAIRAGIEILKAELGVTNDDIEEVFVAGAFGNYISKQSAVAIGLLPPFPREKIKQIGNAAGAGAKLTLLSRDARREALEIAHKTEHVELGGKPAFQNAFAEAMVFPDWRESRASWT